MTEKKKGTDRGVTLPRMEAEGGSSAEFEEAEGGGVSGEDEDGREVAVNAQTFAQKRHSKVPKLLGVLGLGVAIGLGIGYGVRDSQARQTKEDTGGTVQGSGRDAADPCKAWADAICERMGDLAYECTHARAASPLLSVSACAQAQASVLAKIGAIQAERVECSDLTTRFCADLGPEGKGCELARAKEPTFSIKDCRDMKKSYPRVLAQIMERQEKGTLPVPPRASRPSLDIATPN